MKHVASIWTIALGCSGAGCRERIVVAPTPPVWLEAEIEEQAKQQAPDAVRVGNIMKDVSDLSGSTVDFNVQLEDRKCYWFSAAGDETVARLGLYIFEGSGKIAVATKRSRDARALVTHCVRVPGMHRVRLRLAAGAGHVGLGIYATKALQAPAPKAQTWQDIEAQVSEEAGSAAAGATQMGKFYRAEASQQWSVQMTGGKCYWAVVAGGEGVKELALYLWAPGNKRVTENRLDNRRASIGHCADGNGMYRLEAKVVSGSGKYAVGIYQKATTAPEAAPADARALVQPAAPPAKKQTPPAAPPAKKQTPPAGGL